MKISVLVPLYNEVENLPRLYEQISGVAERENLDIEVILVDDGSTDGSYAVLADLAARDQRLRVIRFRRNYGQTAGLAAAIEYATGEILIPMDADLQNDPEDIPRLLAKLEEGYDVVSGWRKDRKDTFFSRRLPSIIANRIISWWGGVQLHDYGCSLKAYRAEFLKEVRLYGEMHRFVPIYANWAGARVTELVVNHRARQFGTSKYGINRTFKVLLDMLTVKFLGDYSTKPIYLFGGAGAVMTLASCLVVTTIVIDKLWCEVIPHKPTWMVVATFLATAGMMLVMMGLLAELLVRIYHESQSKPIFLVREVLNPASAESAEG